MTRLLPRLGAVLVAAFFGGPLAAQLLASLTTDAGGITTAHYAAVLAREAFLRSIANSFLVAAGTTVLCLAVGATAAFALARLDFRGRSLLLGAALAISMFPPIATASPQYLLLRALGLRDSLAGLVFPYTTFALPLTLWLLTSFFRQIPDELYRAARVDGCTPFGAFRRVLLPLVAPGLVTTGLLVFIVSWNELLYALTLLSSPEKRTVPVAIALFAGEHGDPWGQIAAASMLASLPLVVLALVFERRLVSGLTAGAVKG